MSPEEQQVITEFRKQRLIHNNARQAFKGAKQRQRRIAGRIKELHTDIKHYEANLRTLEEQLPLLKMQFEDAERLLLPLEKRVSQITQNHKGATR